jgi:hypothetical protein
VRWLEGGPTVMVRVRGSEASGGAADADEGILYDGAVVLFGEAVVFFGGSATVDWKYAVFLGAGSVAVDGEVMSANERLHAVIRCICMLWVCVRVWLLRGEGTGCIYSVVTAGKQTAGKQMAGKQMAGKQMAGKQTAETT